MALLRGGSFFPKTWGRGPIFPLNISKTAVIGAIESKFKVHHAWLGHKATYKVSHTESGIHRKGLSMSLEIESHIHSCGLYSDVCLADLLSLLQVMMDRVNVSKILP